MPSLRTLLRPGPLRRCWPVVAALLCGVTSSGGLFAAIRGWERREMQRRPMLDQSGAAYGG